MVLPHQFLLVAVAAIMADSVIAHHSRPRDMSTNPIKRDLEHCSAKLEARGHTKRMENRRAEQAQFHREKRGLDQKSMSKCSLALLLKKAFADDIQRHLLELVTLHQSQTQPIIQMHHTICSPQSLQFLPRINHAFC